MSDTQNKNIDVVVYGSAIVDFICYVDRLPKAGETLHGHKFATGFGGKGANQCVAASRLGASAALVAKLGADSWGIDYLRKLQDENISVEYVKLCPEESTGIAQIAVDKGGENHIVIVAGANNKLDCKDVEQAETLFKNAKVLLCQLETPSEGVLKALKSFKGISILNAAPAVANISKELIKAATILCVNETEAALMCQCDDIQTLDHAKIAVNKLLEMEARNVIITLGAQGAVYAEIKEKAKCIHVPAIKVDNVLDTTGAGDAFLGALAYRLAYYPEEEFHQQVGFANYVGSYSVQFLGTQPSFPKVDDIKIDLRQKFPYTEI